MSKILIKNGKALIIKNNDVVIEEINILIENSKIKKMEKNLAKTYNPKDFEDRIYEMWETNGAFRAEAD